MRRIGSVLEVLIPVALFGLWWVASADSTHYAFPPLSSILDRFAELWFFDRVASDVLPSLGRFLAGWFLAAVVGVAFGVVLGKSVVLRKLFDPALQFLRALPPPALLPIFLLLMGIGSSMQVMVIFAGAVWPVLLNTMEGVRGVNPVLNDTASSFQVRSADRILMVTLPSAASSIFAGLRTALGIALVLMIVSEMIAAVNGLGYFTIQAQRTYALADMWAGMLLLGILGFGLNALFTLLERRALYWLPASNSSSARK